jgi:hypothetical protein
VVSLWLGSHTAKEEGINSVIMLGEETLAYTSMHSHGLRPALPEAESDGPEYVDRFIKRIMAFD